METLKQLKARFGSAFKRFSREHTKLSRMRAVVPHGDVSNWIHGINAQTTRLSIVEHDYRSVRLEYAKRLLGRDSRD